MTPFFYVYIPCESCLICAAIPTIQHQKQREKQPQIHPDVVWTSCGAFAKKTQIALICLFCLCRQHHAVVLFKEAFRAVVCGSSVPYCIPRPK